MPRRKNDGLASDLLDVASKLPWWVGVVLAVVAYLGLHLLAGQQAAVASQPGHVGAMAVQVMIKQGASLLQYILPLIFLAGAGMSAWRRRERQTLAANVAKSPAADVLDGMSWQQFEQLVSEAFRMQGYTVTETGGGGADGGIDLVLAKGGEKFLVQCKQWRAFKVGVDVVRELYGVMAAKGATGGFVVTSGRYTAEATSFASGRNVKLIDGPALHALIRQAQRSAPSTVPQPSPPRPAPALAPSCPVCSKAMVKRVAKKGANAGREFWGCSGYPACRGTVSIT